MHTIQQICIFNLINWGELDYVGQELLTRAVYARKHASAPQSHFLVGAALRAISGGIYFGCNVEDIAHSGMIHAESAALAAMISREGNKARFESIAIALGPESADVSCPPKRTGPDITELAGITATICGHCRTVLSPYGISQGPIKTLSLQPNGQILVATLQDLYPLGFNF